MVVKRIFLIFSIVSLFSNMGVAQFNIDAFLASARNDLSLNPTQAKRDFLKENDFNGPWISRMEFRIGSQDANFSMDDYRLRITPGNPGELKANKRYFDKQVALLNTEYQDKLNDALIDRYVLILEHIFEFKKMRNLSKQLEINNQIIEMMSQSTSIYAMDIGDLIDAESDELDLKMDIENAKIFMDEVAYLMKGLYTFSGEIEWNEEELMDTEDILTLFAQFKNKPSGEFIDLVKLDQRNALAAERFNIEKSEALRNIGYFQAGYDVLRGNEPSEHFGYQIGVRIPIVNPDKPQLNRRKLDLMDDEALLDEKKEDHRKNLELAVLRMDHFAQQHKEIMTKLESISQQNILNLQSPGKSIKIADLIKLNEFHMDLMEKQNQVEKKIFKTYIEYLNLNGKLTEFPMRNYLSKNLSEF